MRVLGFAEQAVACRDLPKSLVVLSSGSCFLLLVLGIVLCFLCFLLLVILVFLFLVSCC